MYLKELLYDVGHVLGGVTTSITTYFIPHMIPYIIAVVILFLFYQLDEQYHIDDEAWEDIREFLVGIFIGMSAVLIMHSMPVLRQ
ncbi:MAG: hypothetical protein QXW52_06995 [Candidatus Caldarchaeum sp.]